MSKISAVASKMDDQKRWITYTAAGIAAAAAGTDEADAAIVYSGILNIPVLNSFEVLSTSLGGIFAGLSHQTVFSSVFQGGAYAIGAPGAGQVAGFGFGGYFYAYNLNSGVPLSLPFFVAQGAVATMAFTANSVASEFLNPGIGFLGFRFDFGNGPQFAWARVDMAGRTLNDFVLVDFAYGTPGQALNVGQTEVIPEPSSLGLLAIGAAGLLATRAARRRQAKHVVAEVA